MCVLSHISPTEHLFVLKTLSRTQRATKVKIFVGILPETTAFKSYAAKHERKSQLLIIPTYRCQLSPLNKQRRASGYPTIVNNIQPCPKLCLLMPLALVGARTDSTTSYSYNARRGQLPRTRIGHSTQDSSKTCAESLHFRLFINSRRACAARVTVVVLCVCLSVKSHLTYGASVRPENAVTYSAGNEGKKICGVFSENASLLRSSGSGSS